MPYSGENQAYAPEALIADDIAAYLDAQQHKEMLRFITCGSVDDGKSTLIGRLLYDSKMIFEDQLTALEGDSAKHGTQGDAIDFALLVDGLAAEREQGITIDVAYRFFATEKRKFIVADTPGHEQYTRNMVTGASTADLAVILVDARKGVLEQTKRHSFLVHLLGIRHLVLAVNKMDLVGYDQAIFDRIVADYQIFAKEIGAEAFTPIPISGFKGDNITTAPSANTPWYAGSSLIDHLETVELANTRAQERAFRMPVQWVNRPNLDFRGFAGLISGGSVKPGDPVRIVPSGKTSKVKRIVSFDGDQDEAVAGQSVTLTLKDEVDCSRGDVIAAADDPPEASDQFEATIVWMDEQAMKPGRGYWLKLGSQTVTANVQAPKYEICANTFEHLAAKTLKLNGIGVAELRTDQLQRLGRQMFECVGQDAEVERDWRGRAAHRSPDHVRTLCQEPPAWRVHPDRQIHQCDGCRRDDSFQPAPRTECALASDGDWPRSSRRAEESEAARALVHRAFRFRQIDHCQ